MTGIAAEYIDLPGTGNTIDPFPLDYDPTEHLLPEAHHPNIATIPGSDDFLLRWYPFAPDSAQRARAEELEHQLRRTETHLAALASYGVGLPDRSHFIGPSPQGAGEVVYSVVERLDGHKLRPTREREHTEPALRVAGALLKLCDDTLTHGTPDFPQELTFAQQYTVTPVATPVRPNVVIHDIEARLEPCPTEEQRAVLVHQTLTRLSVWAPSSTEFQAAQASVRQKAARITPAMPSMLTKRRI
jgi:hypothetical protein